MRCCSMVHTQTVCVIVDCAQTQHRRQAKGNTLQHPRTHSHTHSAPAGHLQDTLTHTQRTCRSEVLAPGTGGSCMTSRQRPPSALPVAASTLSSIRATCGNFGRARAHTHTHTHTHTLLMILHHMLTVLLLNSLCIGPARKRTRAHAYLQICDGTRVPHRQLGLIL
jgi:hypothetical protein